MRKLYKNILSVLLVIILISCKTKKENEQQSVTTVKNDTIGMLTDSSIRVFRIKDLIKEESVSYKNVEVVINNDKSMATYQGMHISYAEEENEGTQRILITENNQKARYNYDWEQHKSYISYPEVFISEQDNNSKIILFSLEAEYVYPYVVFIYEKRSLEYLGYFFYELDPEFSEPEPLIGDFMAVVETPSKINIVIKKEYLYDYSPPQLDSIGFVKYEFKKASR